MRWVLEGTWSGYRSSQSRIVHCETTRSKSTLERFKKITCIRYTDGTTLDLRVREAKPREKIKENPSYHSLIYDCLAEGLSGYCSVDELIAARNKRQSMEKVTRDENQGKQRLHELAHNE